MLLDVAAVYVRYGALEGALTALSALLQQNTHSHRRTLTDRDKDTDEEGTAREEKENDGKEREEYPYPRLLDAILFSASVLKYIGRYKEAETYFVQLAKTDDIARLHPVPSPPIFTLT